MALLHPEKPAALVGALIHISRASPYHGGEFVREDGRQERHVAYNVTFHMGQLPRRILRLGVAVEIAHPGRIAAARTNKNGARRRRVCSRSE